MNPYTHPNPAEPVVNKECKFCKRYFKSWSCGKDKGTGECDCPKCQGYCECEDTQSRQVAGDHYIKLDVQPWDAMQSWFCHEQFQAYLLMNAIKYIARDKGSKKEDIAKAHHYLEKWLELNR